MRRLLGMMIGAAVLAAPQMPAWAAYVLPEETAAYLPGPNLELVQQNCSACHSADYVATQPRPLANARGFWQAEVTKMKAAYGAPIDPADVPKLVDYLAEVYGR